MDVILAAGQMPEVPSSLCCLVAAVTGGTQWELWLKRKVSMLTCMAVSVLTHPAVWQLSTQLRATARALQAEDRKDRGQDRTRMQEFL